jgi:hypothetical protein
MVKSIPHPGVALRNFLNKRYPLSPTKIKNMAKALNLSIGVQENTPSVKRGKKVTHAVKVAPGQKADSALNLLQHTLGSLGVKNFLGGSVDGWDYTINVMHADFWTVISGMQQWFALDPDVLLELEDKRRVHPSEASSLFEGREPGNFKLLCIENYGGPQSAPVAAVSQIVVNLWSPTNSYAGQTIYESGVSNSFAKRVRKQTIDKFFAHSGSLEQLSANVVSGVNFPIDVVYTWVNDQDESWNAQRLERAATIHKSVRGHVGERWKNRDELKFSLRSLDMFAPWVRHIYIVTCGQTPEWLDHSNPRISIVDHNDIWRNKDLLPSFNSSAIETQLHHIPGLSEHFIYFNDDFFLGSFCTPEDFFLPNGDMRYFPSDQRVYEHDIDETSEEYIFADFNAITLISKKYGRYGREIMQHVPYASRKSLLEKLEAEFQEEFDACASEPFRSRKDLRPIAFMQYHAGVQEGIAVPSNISHRYLALWKPSIDKQFQGVARTRKYKTFCINDVGVTAERQQLVDRLVNEFLLNYFPFRSQFER